MTWLRRVFHPERFAVFMHVDYHSTRPDDAYIWSQWYRRKKHATRLVDGLHTTKNISYRVHSNRDCPVDNGL